MKLNLFLVAIIIKIIGTAVITPSASSQITPDNTLPTQVERSGNEDKITGGKTAGNNLFHSFREFSIPPGITAIIDHAGNIKNIFSRVTGDSVSNIEGKLTTNGSANFFLINPNGIVFGPNAQLDVGGSFLASTATSIKFADGTEFSSTNLSTPPILTVSVPIGLQFGNNPGSIINRSVSLPKNPITRQGRDFNVGLRINPGNTLALVGGEIRLETGNLTAIGGRIELGSVGSNSFVSLLPINQGWQLGYEGVQNFSDIQLSNDSFVDASDAGGTASLTGRNITLTTGSRISIDTIEAEPAGTLTLNASSAVEVIRESPRGFSTLSAGAGPNATAHGGNIIINTPRLTIGEGGALGLSTVGPGRGGQVIINAQKLVEVVGVGPTGSSTLTSSTNGQGDAGSITINTERMVVSNGGQVTALTASEGNGGLITINASQSVEVSGKGTVTNSSGSTDFSSSISATSGSDIFNLQGIGPGGNININTGQLRVSNGGIISVGTFRGGTAGNLTINANSIFLNRGQLSAQSTSGAGGNIFINASNLLTLRNNSSISATAGTLQTGGDGGNISITAPFIIAVPSENSDISADAFSGTGGNVSITETGLFGLAFRSQPTPLSDITASSQFGQAGTVTFNRPEVDPQTGLVTLPSEIVSAENVVVQNCGAGGAFAGGEFIITGRGGFPSDPYEVPELNVGLADLGVSTLEPSQGGSQPKSPKQTSTRHSPSETIIEAQGWITDSQGNLILTAQVSTVTPSTSGLSSAHCQQLYGHSPSVPHPN